MLRIKEHPSQSSLILLLSVHCRLSMLFCELIDSLLVIPGITPSEPLRIESTDALAHVGSSFPIHIDMHPYEERYLKSLP